MCVNYITVSKNILTDAFDAPVHGAAPEWPIEAYQDYPAPIIRRGGAGRREALVATYGMVPKAHIGPGVKRYSTMNARAETVDRLRSFASAWKAGQLCLVPMHAFFEPNWESGSAVRWKIGMADDAPFAVAGLYRTWREADGSTSFSFTQLTINADQHPLLMRFHRPGDEKRSLVIVPGPDYDAWLGCTDAAQARSFLQLTAPQLLAAAPAPKPTIVKPASAAPGDGARGTTLSLF
jgi:putative SOS response-associated peptidase YedK